MLECAHYLWLCPPFKLHLAFALDVETQKVVFECAHRLWLMIMSTPKAAFSICAWCFEPHKVVFECAHHLWLCPPLKPQLAFALFDSVSPRPQNRKYEGTSVREGTSMSTRAHARVQRLVVPEVFASPPPPPRVHKVSTFLTACRVWVSPPLQLY